jgi:hypothetical protein
MTDSGLSTRLRQQSRRAGLMVGITMALAIAICIVGSAGLFAWLSRPFSDLIPMVAPAAEIVIDETPAAQVAAQQPAEQPALQVESEPTVAPAQQTAETPAAEDFTPTHQISASSSVNFRTGPSTSDPIINALPPATPLQYLGEDAPTTDPSDGNRWMKFRTENGDEGWVREIDTDAYQP